MNNVFISTFLIVSVVIFHLSLSVFLTYSSLLMIPSKCFSFFLLLGPRDNFTLFLKFIKKHSSSATQIHFCFLLLCNNVKMFVFSNISMCHNLMNQDTVRVQYMILLFHVASVKVTQCYSADLWSLLVCPRWFHSNVWSLGRKTQMAGLPGTTVPNSYTCPFRFSNLGIIGLIIPWIKTLRECSKRLRLNHSLLITQPLNFYNIPTFTFSCSSK